MCELWNMAAKEAGWWETVLRKNLPASFWIATARMGILGVVELLCRMSKAGEKVE